MPARHSPLAALAALAAGLAACGDARPLLATPGNGGGQCTSCHGGTDNTTGAPPTDLAGGTATTASGVGAHSAHVAAGSLAGAFGCAECHQLVTAITSPGHNNGTVDLPFGDLSKTGGVTPGWNPGAPGGPNCSSVYCHGNFPGGNAAAPVWTRVGQGEAACGTCHDAPPPAPHPQNPACSGCHPETVRQDGTIDVLGGKHVDGIVQVGNLSCTSCHGGVDNATGAPPTDLAGNTATTARGVGAHTSHVEAGAVAGAFDCGECHVKPAAIDSPGHDNGTVEVVFGTLAGTGAASPAWNGGASPPTCSSVYCHGATLGGGAGTILTPAWTVVDGSQASCGKCHGLPPTGHAALAAGSTNQTCAVCHDQTVLASGSIDVPGGKHVNGLPEVVTGLPHPAGWLTPASPEFHANAVNSGGPAACQTCHAFQPPAQVTTVVCSTCHNGALAPSLASCTGCHGGTDNATGAPPRTTWGNEADAVRVGAHTSHLEGTHLLANPVACSECHVVPADAFAAGHIDQATATLTWGTLATTGGANPQWTRTPPATCSATYCHGSTLPAGTGTPNRTPVWTTTDGSQITCGTACHGSPPLTGPNVGGFPAHVWHVTAPAGPQRGCGTCHSGYTSGSVTTATHVNGTIQVTAGAAGWDCGACH